jgi:oligopeptidase A
MSHNPLLEQSQLPDFEQIKPEHIQPAVEECIQHARKTIDEVLEHGDFSWNGLIEPLTDADEKLEHVWAPVSHLNSVLSTPELREAHDSCLPLLSDYATYVGQHKGLFDAYQALRESDEFDSLTEAQQKLINDTLRDFRLSGVDLPEDKKKRYAEISSRLSDLSSTFSNNLLDATHAWTCLITDESRLAGLPESIKEAAKETAADQEKEGWLFTLDIPSYLPVMLYAEDRELRKEMYQAFVTRASETGPNGGEFDNSEVMNETLALRHEMSELLGFNDFAEMSLATKMAESPEQVLDFVQELANKSKAQAKAEYAEIETFAAEQGVEKMEAWDVPYFSEQLKQQRYSISDELLRPYFPEQQVLNGLFEVVKRLFGMTVSEQKDVKTWHENVQARRRLDGGFCRPQSARRWRIAKPGGLFNL